MAESVTAIETTDTPHKRRPRRRAGKPSKRDQHLLEEVLKQRTAPVTPREEKALAQVFDRSVATIKSMVQTARDKFAERAEFYVDAHKDAVAGAIQDRDFEVAANAAQWAMKEIASEGVRVIDRANDAVQVPRVMIGIKLGGLTEDTRPNAPAVTVEAESVVEP